MKVFIYFFVAPWAVGKKDFFSALLTICVESAPSKGLSSHRFDVRLKLVTEFQQSHLFACLLLPLLPPSLPASVFSSCSPSAWTRECLRRGKRDCPLFHNVTALFDSHMRSRSSFFGSFPHQHLMPWLIWFSLVGNLLSLAAWCHGWVCRLGTSGTKFLLPRQIWHLALGDGLYALAYTGFFLFFLGHLSRIWELFLWSL